jgi:hypothetical protein
MVIISFEIIDYFEKTKKAYFKILGKEVYEVRIVIEDGVAFYKAQDCTCIFGSHFSQTKTNTEQGKVCRHIKEVLNFLEEQAWIEKSQNINLINNGTN